MLWERGSLGPTCSKAKCESSIANRINNGEQSNSTVAHAWQPSEAMKSCTKFTLVPVAVAQACWRSIISHCAHSSTAVMMDRDLEKKQHSCTCTTLGSFVKPASESALACIQLSINIFS